MRTSFLNVVELRRRPLCEDESSDDVYDQRSAVDETDNSFSKTL
tara:strand:- start:1004 stop:1135 length:132 start_codon:yes stop_codon:yes gene_type:complete